MNSKRLNKIGMIPFVMLFVVEAWIGGTHLPVPDGALLFVLVGLAAARGGRTIAFDGVFKWLRDWIGVREVYDTSGAGNSNEAPPAGWRHVLGELICCPLCAGSHVGGMLLVLYSTVPQLGLGLIYALAASAVVEMFHWTSEFFGWNGRLAREKAGTNWLAKNGRELDGTKREDDSTEKRSDGRGNEGVTRSSVSSPGRDETGTINVRVRDDGGEDGSDGEREASGDDDASVIWVLTSD